MPPVGSVLLACTAALNLVVATSSNAQSVSAEQDRTLPLAAINITPDNVELDGAGNLNFAPDSKAFDIDPSTIGAGLSLKVRLWLDPKGKPSSCEIGSQALPKIAQAACAQLTKSATFQIFPGMALPLRKGFVDVQFSFYIDPQSGPSGLKIFAFTNPAYNNGVINYPADETSPADRLQPSAGNLAISIQADDYPATALRYSLESTSAVLIGISRDGLIKSCRPVSSSGTRTAFLDNYTCSLFIKRAKFSFIAEYPDYSDLRYLTKRMLWKLP